MNIKEYNRTLNFNPLKLRTMEQPFYEWKQECWTDYDLDHISFIAQHNDPTFLNIFFKDGTTIKEADSCWLEDHYKEFGHDNDLHTKEDIDRIEIFKLKDY